MAAVYGSLKTRMFLDTQMVISDCRHADNLWILVAAMTDKRILSEAMRGIYPIERGTRDVPF